MCVFGAWLYVFNESLWNCDSNNNNEKKFDNKQATIISILQTILLLKSLFVVFFFFFLSVFVYIIKTRCREPTLVVCMPIDYLFHFCRLNFTILRVRVSIIRFILHLFVSLFPFCGVFFYVYIFHFIRLVHSLILFGFMSAVNKIIKNFLLPVFRLDICTIYIIILYTFNHFIVCMCVFSCNCMFRPNDDGFGKIFSLVVFFVVSRLHFICVFELNAKRTYKFCFSRKIYVLLQFFFVKIFLKFLSWSQVTCDIFATNFECILN